MEKPHYEQCFISKVSSPHQWRQGDPLSPYLFVICTEILVQMLKLVERKRRISGLRVARRAPPVTHLLFADDSMLYCKGADSELDQVINLLQL